MLLIKIILDLSLAIVLSLLFVNLINWLYSIMDKKLMEKIHSVYTQGFEAGRNFQEE